MSFIAKSLAAKSFSADARPRFELGQHTVKVVGAEYGKNQAGTGFRGLWKVEGVNGELTNTYLTEGKTDEQSASNLKPYIEVLLAAGVAQEKIEGDAENWQDIINNIVSIANRLIRNNVAISAVLSIKANPKDETKPHKNIFPVTKAMEMPVADEATKAAFAAASAPAADSGAF